MAAGLAQKMLEGRGEAESAGIAPVGHRAADEAIRLMRREGIDLSHHKPRQVMEVCFEDYDYIVSLDPTVHRHLKQRYGVGATKLVSWEIDDPYGQDIDTYKTSFESIRSHLEDFLTKLGLAFAGDQ
jgi:protein-tyrosine-phosphatase